MINNINDIEEEWRVVPSLLEYEASSWGRVRRKPWEAPMPNGGLRVYGGYAWTGVWEPQKGRFILMYRGRTYKVARLICEAFHGSAPEDRPYCLHQDEDARNNRPENLAWGTQKENLNAPGFLKYCRGRTGEANPYVKGRMRRP